MALKEDGIFYLTTANELEKHNLSKREIACPCCGVIKIGMPTVAIFEAVRAEVGPHWINCGYRCGRHQRSLEGRYHASTLGDLAPHPLALAVDSFLPTRFSYRAYAQLIERKAKELHIPVRIGWKVYQDRSDGIVHYDTVPLLARVRSDVGAVPDYRVEARW